MNKVVATLTRVDSNSHRDSPGLEHHHINESSDHAKRYLPEEIILTQGRHVLGRGKRADIFMTIRVNQKEIISRAHAEIICTNNEIIFVKDLNSMNGVFVNGLRIENQMLYENDIIQIGGMSNMPAGKKLKVSADNVRYRFQYKNDIPQVLRHSVPPSAMTAHSGERAIMSGEKADQNEKVKDPFKRDVNNQHENETKSSGSTSVSTPTHPQLQLLSPNNDTSSRKRCRTSSTVTSETVLTKDKEANIISESKLLKLEQECERLRTLLTQAESTVERQSITLRRNNVQNEEMKSKEVAWNNKCSAIEKQLVESKFQHDECSRLLVAKDNELKITEEKYNNEITSLMQKFQDDRNGYAAQLQAAHDEDIRKNQNEWDQKFNEVQNELKELRQSHDRQKEIISQQDKTLKDKSIAISVLQSSHDKELLEKDGLWADKMNAFLKNSADDVQTFRTQLQNLRDRSVKDQEQIRSYQAQVASLQTSLETATVLSVANAKSVSNSDDKQNGVCTIGVDALREYIMCALCQQPMLDAVVCRCSHGFCHACLEMYIHNENDRIARDSSKYSIHKTIATIKAGNVSGNKVDPMNEKNIVKDPYENFACPVCQHDEEERGHSCGAAQIKNRKSTIPFHRSENLDSIIYLCQQASSLADREAFEQREATNFHLLKTLGIDPMASPVGCSNNLNGSISSQGYGNEDSRSKDVTCVDHNNNEEPHTASSRKVVTLSSNGNVLLNPNVVLKSEARANVDSESDNDSTIYGNYNDDNDGNESNHGYD